MAASVAASARRAPDARQLLSSRHLVALDAVKQQTHAFPQSPGDGSIHEATDNYRGNGADKAPIHRGPTGEEVPPGVDRARPDFFKTIPKRVPRLVAEF